MVKYSLEKMIEKYPYFMNKEEDSNNYKVTKAFNTSFQYLYNDLYKIYEDFHLNKRIYIWKEQNEKYTYKINFHAEYYDYDENNEVTGKIKSITIYKNDIPILKRNYNLGVCDTFDWTYNCSYVETNMKPINVYKCLSCGTIYFDDVLPVTCTTTFDDGTTCGGYQYQKQKVFECTPNHDSESTVNAETNTVDVRDVEIYFGVNLEEVLETNSTVYNNLNDGEFYCSNNFTEVNVYRCFNCGQIWFSENQPPEYCTCVDDENHPIPSYVPISPPIYYDDSHILIHDNSENYIEEGLIISRNFTVKITKQDDSPLAYAAVELHSDSLSYDSVNTTLSDGSVVFNEVANGDYTLILHNSEGNAFNIPCTVSSDTVGLNLKVDFSQSKEISKEIVTETYISTQNEDFDMGDQYHVEIPFIPIDNFKMEVETWDEYLVCKGFPEKDTPSFDASNNLIPSVYDHDYSLDNIGLLNNIPRKKYVSVESDDDYFYTEPPFNNQRSEDDYHYMNRIIEYMLRQNGDIDLLHKTGYISDEDYEGYVLNPKSIPEDFNPTTLELWKMYGISSQLINRERYLLKVFDVSKHNTKYVNNEDLSECWTPRVWEHKDRFCDGSGILGVFFYVVCSNLRPVKKENVVFTFKLLNGLAEEISDNYTVSITKLGAYVPTSKLDEYNRLTDNAKQYLKEYHQLSDREKQSNALHVIHTNLEVYTETNNINPDNYTFVMDHPIPFEKTYTDKVEINHSEIYNNVTLFEFAAYNENNELIGKVKLPINQRNCTNADWYINTSTTFNKTNSEKIDYGKNTNNPFTSLEECLEYVTGNNNVICLTGNTNITEPIPISQSCTILGIDEPEIIRSDNGETFFSIVGGKNCKLTLIDVKLKNNKIESLIDSTTWLNNNNLLDKNSQALTHGSTVRLQIGLNDSYYPYDTVNTELKLTLPDGTPLPDNTLNIYYKTITNQIGTVVTGTNGEATFTFTIDESSLGDYPLFVRNVSDEYFELTFTSYVHVNKAIGEVIGNHIQGVVSDEYANKRVCLYIISPDGLVDVSEFTHNNTGLIGCTTIGPDGTISYDYTIPPGRFFIIAKIEGSEDIIYVWNAESSYGITSILGKSNVLVKNFNIEDDGDITYDVLTITENTILRNLDGVLLGLDYTDLGGIQYTTFKPDVINKGNSKELSYSDVLTLQKAFTNLKLTGTVLSWNVLGEKWWET